MLLERNAGATSHRVFRELPELLAPGDLLVVNRSRVFPARLLGRKRHSDGAAEILLLRPLREAGEWEALVRPGRRLHAGDRIFVSAELTVEIRSQGFGADGRRRVRLETEEDAWAVVERLGHVPLPPYVARLDRAEDRHRYQTVYARERGSVAAPTAGLHFTDALFARLAARGVSRAEVILHVGPGTFRPVKVENVEDHRVDPEPFEIPEPTAQAMRDTRARGGRVVAVGTTVVRTLETCAQDDGNVKPGRGETACVIVPGFRFRAVNGLVTNFHLPRSSLLLLVAAFGGRERVLAAYAEAVRQRYRFYSYGDAMLLL